VKVVDNTKKKSLQSEVRQHVLAGCAIFTDALQSYSGLDEFQHEVLDHAVGYVRGPSPLPTGWKTSGVW
jgi:ISXO2-like transposase domain